MTFSVLGLFCFQASGNFVEINKAMPVIGIGAFSDEIPVGTYWFDGKKWHLRLAIGVYGLNLFKALKQEEAEFTASWQKRLGLQHSNVIDWSQIGPVLAEKGSSIKSLGDLPYMRALIENQIRGVERNFNSDFLETKIDLFFIDESKMTSLQELSKKSGRKKLSQGRIDFLPVLYIATPEPTVIRPGIFDPFAASPYIAHEVFHRIALNQFNDGYLFWDYPVRGIMNGGNEYQMLFEKGLEPQIVPVEWNTFLRIQFARQNPDVDLSKPEIANRFRPNYFTENPDNGDSKTPWNYIGDSNNPPNRPDLSFEDREKLHLKMKAAQLNGCEDLLTHKRKKNRSAAKAKGSRT